MNYLEIEFSGRTMMILGGLTTIAIIFIVVLIAVRLAKRYNKAKQNG